MKKMNFIITINGKEYIFKYTQNDYENLSLTLDLNLNDSKELLITDKIELLLILKNKKSSLILQKEKEQIDKSKLNQFYLLLIEKFINSPKIDKKTCKNIYKDVLNELNHTISSRTCIKNNYNFRSLFKISNNIVVNVFSIFYFIGKYEKYLDERLIKFEKEFFEMLILVIEEMLNEPSESFETKLNNVVNMAKYLYIILNNNSYLINISYNENYIADIIKNSSLIEDKKKVKTEIMNEIKAIDIFISKYSDFPAVKKIIEKYRKQLVNECTVLNKDIRNSENLEFKQLIKNKIELVFIDEKIKRELLKILENKI